MKTSYHGKHNEGKHDDKRDRGSSSAFDNLVSRALQRTQLLRLDMASFEAHPHKDADTHQSVLQIIWVQLRLTTVATSRDTAWPIAS